MPTRTLQGARNSTANFQSNIEPCFAQMRHAFKDWLDDFAIHAETEAELLNRLEEFLDTCRMYNLKVSLPKCDDAVGLGASMVERRVLAGTARYRASKSFM